MQLKRALVLDAACVNKVGLKSAEKCSDCLGNSDKNTPCPIRDTA